jgi:hypothetical protein
MIFKTASANLGRNLLSLATGIVTAQMCSLVGAETGFGAAKRTSRN